MESLLGHVAALTVGICSRRKVEATLEQIKIGQVKVTDIPRITIVELEAEQGYVSMNNRRLWVFKQCKRKPKRPIRTRLNSHLEYLLVQL
jgi:hypothetical protein